MEFADAFSLEARQNGNRKHVTLICCCHSPISRSVFFSGCCTATATGILATSFCLPAGERSASKAHPTPWTPLRMSALPADKMNALCGWSQKSGMNLVPGALRALSFGDLPHRTWSFRTQDAHTALPDVVVNHGKCSCDPKDFLVYFYTQFS